MPCLYRPDLQHRAVRLDAACVCVNLLKVEGEGAEELYHQCVQNVAALKAECDRFISFLSLSLSLSLL
jgi:hypothetical protein